MRQLSDLPHVDEILGQGNTLSIPSDGDGSVKISWSISVLTVGDPDHCSRQLPVKWSFRLSMTSILTIQILSLRTLVNFVSVLPDFSYFGSPFANDAANEFIWNCHLMGLLLGRVSVLSSQ